MHRVRGGGVDEEEKERTLVSDGTAKVLEKSPNFLSLTVKSGGPSIPSGKADTGKTGRVRPYTVTCFTRL
jgi:hypothetical protein